MSRRPELARPDLVEPLGAVKLLSVDVDGVLTDGGLYVTDDGRQSRKFNVRDGVGMKRVLAAGFELAIVSASAAPSIRHRGEILGVRHVFIGVEDKLVVISGLCRDLGIGLADVAHVGDDLNDLPLLRAVGCPLSVADAVPEVRQAAVFVTKNGGGAGAVREICDLVVEARAASGGALIPRSAHARPGPETKKSRAT